MLFQLFIHSYFLLPHPLYKNICLIICTPSGHTVQIKLLYHKLVFLYEQFRTFSKYIILTKSYLVCPEKYLLKQIIVYIIQLFIYLGIYFYFFLTTYGVILNFLGRVSFVSKFLSFLPSFVRFEMILIKILITRIISHIFCRKTGFWIYNCHRRLSFWPLVQHSAAFESQPCTHVKKETHRAVPSTSLLCSDTYQALSRSRQFLDFQKSSFAFNEGLGILLKKEIIFQ